MSAAMPSPTRLLTSGTRSDPAPSRISTVFANPANRTSSLATAACLGSNSTHVRVAPGGKLDAVHMALYPKNVPISTDLLGWRSFTNPASMRPFSSPSLYMG